MALSKLTFLAHLKTLTNPKLSSLFHPPPQLSSFISVKSLSFATTEEAAAERRRRKRRLRIEPPLSSLRSQNQQSQQPRPQQAPAQNPNAPKTPEPVTALTGKRLGLHNDILALIRVNDLDEASLLTRHSIYSNCRPTIYTVNAVLNALLRQSRYSDLLSLHRFITQAGVAPNVITHNLLINAYCDCRKTDTALEHYKQLINDAPFNPSPTTYRILIKGLVDNGKVDKAVELKDEMLSKGFAADPLVYSYLMLGHVKNSNPDGVFQVYEELKEKVGGVCDGVVYGNLMKGYFLRNMEKEAMECYEEVVGENSNVKMSAVAYNSVLDALSKNMKFDEALKLFDRMLMEHNPPTRLSVNLGSFNVMVDGYCAQGRFVDAIEVFRKMGEKRCSPDALSFNNLIEHLCNNGLLVKAEEVYGEMGEKNVNPDECTYVLLMDTCFKESRPDDAANYYSKMVEVGLRPNLAVYNKLVEGLVKVDKIDEAKSFFDMMVTKLKMDSKSYQFMMKTLSDVGKLDEMLKIVDGILDEVTFDFDEEMQEFVKGELKKEGREEELGKLMEEKERQKAEVKAKEVEAAEAANASRKLAVSNLISSNLLSRHKETVTDSVIEGEQTGKEENAGEGETVELNAAASDTSNSLTRHKETGTDSVIEGEQTGKEENVGEGETVELNAAASDTSSAEEASQSESENADAVEVATESTIDQVRV